MVGTSNLGSWNGHWFIFGIFLRQVLELFFGSWFYAFLLLCVSSFLLLLLCVPASLLYLRLVFSASLLSLLLLLCFTCFFSFLLLCFPCFSAFLLFASVPFYFYYSICSFLQSCVFAALLPAPLLLCFRSLLPLWFFCSCALSSPVWKNNTLGETQRNLKETWIRTPDKKAYMKP